MSNAFRHALAGLVAGAVLIASAASAQTAICYNCPPEWADWATQIRLIKEKTGVTVPPDNKNSGQALAQLVAEKASPVADVVYYGVPLARPASPPALLSASYSSARHQLARRSHSRC